MGTIRVADSEGVISAGSKLNAADLEGFARLRIPGDLISRAGVERVTDGEAREKFGICGHGDRAGVIFPYFDPVTGQRHTARLRRDHPEIENGKPKNKYISAYGDRRIFTSSTGAATCSATLRLPSF